MTLEEFTTELTTKLNAIGLTNVEVSWTDPHLSVTAYITPTLTFGSDLANATLEEETIRQVVTDIKGIYKEDE